MKRRKMQLVSGALSMLMVLFSLITASVAWFTMNKETTSNGIQLTVEATANLIISDSTEEIAKSQISQINTDSPFAVTFASNSSTYKPSTHDSTYALYPAGLKYVTNTGDVDILTGLAKSGATLSVDGVVPNTSPSEYFVDFVVYIASFGKQMENVKLKAEIISAIAGSSAVTSGTLMATSIDVYSGTVINPGNFKGTLNVAHSENSIYILGGSASTGTVPHNRAASDNYLTYTLRCYFDGALESTSGQAYIYTALLDTSTVTLNLRIYVED